jgi:uncharacterized oligopeptide transporter (OPT) family protein
MAAVIQTLMSDQPVPWLLYGVGALLILVLQMIKVPALPFALGMYLPQQLTTPLLVGGLVAHFVAASAKGNEKLEQARTSRGTLIASGFIAGGAVMGVVAAFLKLLSQGFSLPLVGWTVQLNLGVNLFNSAEGHGAELLALLFYVGLVAYMFLDAKRGRIQS